MIPTLRQVYLSGAREFWSCHVSLWTRWCASGYHLQPLFFCWGYRHLHRGLSTPGRWGRDWTPCGRFAVFAILLALLWLFRILTRSLYAWDSRWCPEPAQDYCYVFICPCFSVLMHIFSTVSQQARKPPRNGGQVGESRWTASAVLFGIFEYWIHHLRNSWNCLETPDHVAWTFMQSVEGD